jgi:hypothetical protein
MKKVEVAGLGTLEFPDETPDNVIQATVKRELAALPKQGPQMQAGAGWGDVTAQAMLNAPGSAMQFAKDMATPILHPVDTAKSVASLVTDPQARAAVGQFYKDRYGGLDNIKQTIAKDPVGFLGDVATPLTMGGAGLARAPGVVGRAGRVAQTAGKIVDPMTVGQVAVSKGADVAGKAASNVLGLTTGAGTRSIEEAFRVGREGTPEAREDFTANMRGKTPQTDVLRDAVDNLQQIKADRRANYEAQMRSVGADQTQLDFRPIADAWVNLRLSYQTPSGLSKASASTRKTLDDIEAALAEWEATPADHNVLGLDGLKQRIQDLYPEAEKNSQGQRAVTNTVKTIKDVIEKQAPQYKDVMAAYEQESRLIQDIERTLSIGDDFSADTAMRKLQSVTRNNVNTNYGTRTNLVQELEDRGGRELMPALAGQATNSLMPRGLASQVAALGFGALTNPAAWPALAAASPRLVGEGAYAAGNMAREGTELAKALGSAPRIGAQASFQTGRMTAEEQKRRALAAALAGQ